MSTEFEVKGLCLKHFDGVGFASAVRPQSLDVYEKWLGEGLHGEMGYLKAYLDRKRDPQILLPGCKSWIVLTHHYDTAEPLSIDVADDLRQNKLGWIARYARGGDYHQLISQKHSEIINELNLMFPKNKFLGCVDTQAVLERDVAAQAGLGWIGKNTCLIDQHRGSFFFISEILTTLELVPDKPVFDHCGTCTRCIDACPTGAIEEPRKLNATKCISYWTIESKVAAPPSLASKFGQNIFGCDICQDVCPWNKKARRDSNLPAALGSGIVDLREFLAMNDGEITERISGTAMSRAKPLHLRENIQVALKNCE
jgi:epoxyqueuosine reductase